MSENGINPQHIIKSQCYWENGALNHQRAGTGGILFSVKHIWKFTSGKEDPREKWRGDHILFKSPRKMARSTTQKRGFDPIKLRTLTNTQSPCCVLSQVCGCLCPVKNFDSVGSLQKELQSVLGVQEQESL